MEEQEGTSGRKPYQDGASAAEGSVGNDLPSDDPQTRPSQSRGGSAVHDSLLDLDGIRGCSAFHTKPAKFSVLLWRGISKVILFPFCSGWWKSKNASQRVYVMGSLLYVLQGSVSLLYFGGALPGCMDGNSSRTQREQLRLEIGIPVMLWLCCALGYGYLVAASRPERRKTATEGLGEGSSARKGGVEADGSDEEEEDTFYSEELQEREKQMMNRAARTHSRGHSAGYPPVDWSCKEDEMVWGLGTGSLPGTVRVTLFDSSHNRYKTPMTLSQIRSHIVRRANMVQQDAFYKYAAAAGALTAALLPTLFSVGTWTIEATSMYIKGEASSRGAEEVCRTGTWVGLFRHVALQCVAPRSACGVTLMLVRVISMCSVLFMALRIFRELSAAELTYKRRYMYAKYFAAITSSTRARRYDVPHFSLKNVLNIKMWLALRAGRSWLRKQEHQRTADTIVSTTFRGVLLLLLLLLIEVFASKEKRPFLSRLLHWELLVWGGYSSLYLLQFMVHGSRINEKYHDITVLLTEQINVQLRICEVSTRANDKLKREKLSVSSRVLDLAMKLLKEQQSPNRVSGISMSPLLYNITRVVLLSALSAAASDLVGFKLKVGSLLKIK